MGHGGSGPLLLCTIVVTPIAKGIIGVDVFTCLL